MASPLTASANQALKASKNEPRSIARRKRKEHQLMNDDNIVDDKEQRLMSTLFGMKNNTTSSITSDQSHSKKKKRPESTKKEAGGDEFTFEIDRIGGIHSDDLRNDDHDSKEKVAEKGATATNSNETTTGSKNSTKKTIAWVDHDDEEDDGENGVLFAHASDRIRKLRQHKEETHVPTRSLYEERLRQRYIQTTQTTSNVGWAQTSNQHDDAVAVDGEYSQPHNANRHDVSVSTSYVNDTVATSQRHARMIPPHIISMKRCPDANRNDPNQSVTKVVQFYRPTNTMTTTTHNSNHDKESTPTLLLTAGLDKTLRFFHCSEESSTKIHGVHCEY
jgi:hypothetical protein